MTKAYVFVEGPTGLEFLRKVLPPEAQQDAAVIDAGGAGYIPSLARSFLVRRRIPVAVFMDADSFDPKTIEERRESTEELIQFAAAGIPVKVIVAVPDLEACFFAAPDLIARVLGEQITTDLVPVGLVESKRALDQLAAKRNRVWDSLQAIREMDAHDIDRIRLVVPVQELIAFLEHIQQLHLAGTKIG